MTWTGPILALIGGLMAGYGYTLLKRGTRHRPAPRESLQLAILALTGVGLILAFVGVIGLCIEAATIDGVYWPIVGVAVLVIGGGVFALEREVRKP